MCTDVRTGTIILAMIGLLAGGFSVISDSVGLGYYAPLIEEKIDQAKFESITKFSELSEDEQLKQGLDYEQMWKQMDFIKSVVPWAFVIQIVTSACNILLNGSMLYGITQKKPGFMLPWLIVGMTGIVLSIAVLALGFFVLSIGTPAGILNGVILLLLATPIVWLMLYFWLVVRSAYLDLREISGNINTPVDLDEKIEKAGGNYIKM